MDLRQLEYFLAVAEERSFTRGATRAHVVQSAASAAILRLEREIGQPLFVRRGRQLDLTEAGRLLLARARSIQELATQTREELDALRAGLSGTVTIGTILAFGSAALPGALKRFHARYPEVVVQLRLSAGPMESHLSRVTDGTFDLALIPMPERIPKGVLMRRVERVRLGLACSAAHPLADARRVRYRQICDETYIDFPEEWGNRSIVEQLFAAEHCVRGVFIEVTNVAAALTLVAGGLGLSFIPEQFITSSDGVTAIDLYRPPQTISLGIAIAADKTTSPAATALFRFLLDWASANARMDASTAAPTTN